MDAMAGSEVMWAMEQGDEDQAEALLREDPAALSYMGYLREWDYEDFSLLHGAAWYDCPRMVRLLLEMGANKDALSWVYTPLELAIEHGHEEVMSILIQAGADAGSFRGGNTLICAASAELRSDSEEDAQRHFRVLRMALEYVGTQHINAQSRYSVTAVQAACWQGTVEEVRYLVEQGADLTIPNRWGRTPREIVMQRIREIEEAGQRQPARLRRLQQIHALLQVSARTGARGDPLPLSHLLEPSHAACLNLHVSHLPLHDMPPTL